MGWVHRAANYVTRFLQEFPISFVGWGVHGEGQERLGLVHGASKCILGFPKISPGVMWEGGVWQGRVGCVGLPRYIKGFLREFPNVREYEGWERNRGV